MSEKTTTFQKIANALGVSLQAVSQRATREEWAIPAYRRGVPRNIPVDTLPLDVCEALALKDATCEETTEKTALAVVATPKPKAPAIVIDTTSLTTHQLEVESARDRLTAWVADSGLPVAKAIDLLNRQRAAGSLTPAMRWGYDHAWDKKRADNALTPRTYYNWVKAKEERGRAVPAKVEKDMEVKPWYGLAVALKQRPQGSVLTWIHEEIGKQWDASWAGTPPSYDQVRRFFGEKFSAIDQLKGRHTGSALRAHKRYTQRTAEGMEPWQEVHADGWNTHFLAPHPISFEYVTYEVWHFHDVATRYTTPPGIHLTENFEVISKGLENCIRFGGVMAILQTDSTGIVKEAQRWSDLEERVGFTTVHPQEVGNSQANGICENYNSSRLDKWSRELATYQAKGMDSGTLKKVKKLTEKSVKAGNRGDVLEQQKLLAQAEKVGKGLIFKSHQEGVEWINRKVDEDNHKPHSALPKIRDPETGKLRHQSPHEALEAAKAAGWKPVMVDEALLIDLFRPHVRVKVRRETVRPFGENRYKAAGLGDWNGKYVIVAFDIMDWRQVWVKEEGSGALICVAEFDAATPYRAQTSYEVAMLKRANAQIRHKEIQIEAIRARTPGMVLDADADAIPALARLVPDMLEIEAPTTRLVPDLPEEFQQEARIRLPAPLARPQAVEAEEDAPRGRPMFQRDTEKYEWLMRRPEVWTSDDEDWLEDFADGELYGFLKDRFEALGIAWEGIQNEVAGTPLERSAGQVAAS